MKIPPSPLYKGGQGGIFMLRCGSRPWGLETKSGDLYGNEIPVMEKMLLSGRMIRIEEV